jgi:hypothetical protein
VNYYVSRYRHSFIANKRRIIEVYTNLIGLGYIDFVWKHMDVRFW